MRRVNVKSGNGNRTVPRNSRQCPGVAAGLAQACQERMTQAVQNEWTGLAGLDRLRVLLLEAGVEGSKWPLRVGAGHTQAFTGSRALSQRRSKMFLTRGVLASTRCAGAVLP